MPKKQSPSTLLWFIRRKSYVPLCELRRRFELDGDEGSFFDGDDGRRIFAGLPANATAAIEKLWRQGKIGLEFSVEFDCRVLIGVYPISPIRDIELHPQASVEAPVALVPPRIIDMPEPTAFAETGNSSALVAGE